MCIKYNKMILYAFYIVSIYFIVNVEGQINIDGQCADHASKLPCNWLAMAGQWFEVQRSSTPNPLQTETSCVSIDIENKGRNIHINHTYRNENNEIQNVRSRFELTSQPDMEMTFSPGLTKTLTLMGTDYLNTAVFYYCDTDNSSNLTSNLYIWVYCRDRTMSQECRDGAALIFKVRKAQQDMQHLQNTHQGSC